jgi:hypothetical protein
VTTEALVVTAIVFGFGAIGVTLAPATLWPGERPSFRRFYILRIALVATREKCFDRSDCLTGEIVSAEDKREDVEADLAPMVVSRINSAQLYLHGLVRSALRTSARTGQLHRAIPA